MKKDVMKQALRQLKDAIVLLRTGDELYFINRKQLPQWIASQLEPPYRQFNERLATLIGRIGKNQSTVAIIDDNNEHDLSIGTIYASLVDRKEVEKALKLRVDSVIHYRVLRLAKEGMLPIKLSYHIYGGTEEVKGTN